MEQKENIKLIDYKYLKLDEKDKIIHNYMKRLSHDKRNKIFLLIFLIIFIFFKTSIINILSTFICKKENSKCINNIKNEPNIISKLKMLLNETNSLYNCVEKCLTRDPDEELCIYQFLCPKEVKGKKRILVGEKQDGSYITLDDYDNVKIAYSIGIRDIIQFDRALADRGIDVYMYDHTINNLPYENNKFHWKKIGLGGIFEKKENIQTLEDMIKENGHSQENNMILKIDIESAEWNSLKDISEKTLLQFKYILIEYHFTKENHLLYYNVLKKIYKTHQVFYVHCCPFAGLVNFGFNRICQAIEVSYVLRNGNIFTTDNSIYPISNFSYGYNPIFNINILKLFDNYKPS